MNDKNINHYPLTNSELQIPANYINNMEQMQIGDIPDANIFMQNQEPKCRIKYFDNHISNR